MFALLFLFAFASADIEKAQYCWTSAAYHVASQAFAVGVGDPSSNSVCIYGNNTRLSYDCPLACETLISATWGDCYCNDPNYRPDAFGADPLIKPMTVYQVFSVLATSKYATGANCRLWMAGRNSSWTCQ